jgi:hypothetical protein
VGSLGHWALAKPGRSGYPKSLGQVIRVLKNSGIKNCYLIRKKTLPVISGSDITRFTRNREVDEGVRD